MGIVYCARHVHLDRDDAVKLLSEQFIDRPDLRKRFIRESRLAASIRHPNIVPIYSAGETDGGQLYIAMQLIDGSDLHTLRRAEHVLAPEQVLQITEQIGSALDAAHARGLVHRDVKPGNILLDDERAYLGDFGLTKNREGGDGAESDTLTGAGDFWGTPDYAAPEQVNEGEVDGRTDLYALGCVVYECLTGDVPYPRPDKHSKFYAKTHDPIPQVTAKRPDLPPAIDGVIEKALAMEKEDRYSTCREFYEALTEALGVEPASAPPSPPPSRFIPSDPSAPTHPEDAPPSRRRMRLPTWAAASAVGVVAVTVGVVVATSGDNKKNASPPPRTNPTPVPHPPKPPAVPTGISVAKPVQVGRRPFGVLVAGNSVWATAFDDDGVRRIDAATGQVRGELTPVGDGPFGLTSAKGYLWVALNHDDAVVRVDPSTGLATHGKLPACNGPVNVKAAAGLIWVVCENDHLVARLDANTGRVVGKTSVGRLPRGAAVTPGVLWVSSRRAQTVTRLSTATGQILGAPIPVGRDPQALAVVGREIWVTDHGDDTITRIEVKTGRTVGKPIPVGSGPFGIGEGLGYVWVALSGSNQVARLNPRTATVVKGLIRVGKQPSGLAIGAGSVWVTDNNDNAVSRISRTK